MDQLADALVSTLGHVCESNPRVDPTGNVTDDASHCDAVGLELICGCHGTDDEAQDSIPIYANWRNGNFKDWGQLLAKSQLHEIEGEARPARRYTPCLPPKKLNESLHDKASRFIYQGVAGDNNPGAAHCMEEAKDKAKIFNYKFSDFSAARAGSAPDHGRRAHKPSES